MVLAVERLAERHALVAQPPALPVTAAVIGIDEHRAIAESPDRTPVGGVLRIEIGVRRIAVGEQLLRSVLVPKPRAAILHQVVAIRAGAQPVPQLALRRDQRLRDGDEALERDQPAGIDLLRGFLLPRPVEALVEKRVAAVGVDQRGGFFPLLRKGVARVRVLLKLAHDVGDDRRLGVADHPRRGRDLSGQGVLHPGPVDPCAGRAGSRRPPSSSPR
jgi:hypothetical protein